MSDSASGSAGQIRVPGHGAIGPVDDDEPRPLPSHFDLCFGCGPHHPTGLHLQMDGAGKEVRGWFDVKEHHQGAPGLAHGGVISAAMDEGMGFLLWLLATPAVTAHIEVNFRRPVPVGARLRLGGRIDRVDGRKLYASMTGHLGEDLAVDAKALFLTVDVEHFRPHAERMGVLEMEPRTYNP